MDDFSALQDEIYKINQSFLDEIQELYRLGNYNEVIKQINTSLVMEKYPADSSIYYWLGWAYYNSGEKEDAFDSFKRCILFLLKHTPKRRTLESVSQLLNDFDGAMTKNNIDKGNFALAILTDEFFLEAILSRSDLFHLLFSALTPENAKTFIMAFNQNFSRLLICIQSNNFQLIAKACETLNLPNTVNQFFHTLSQNPTSINYLSFEMLKQLCRFSMHYMTLLTEINALQSFYDLAHGNYDVILKTVNRSSLNMLFHGFIAPAAIMLKKPEAITFFLKNMRQCDLCMYDLFKWIPTWLQYNYFDLVKDYISLLDKNDSNDHKNSAGDASDDEANDFDFNYCATFTSIIAHALEKNLDTHHMSFLLQTFYQANSFYFDDYASSCNGIPEQEHFLIAAINANCSADIIRCVCDNFRILPEQNKRKPIIISHFRDSTGKIALHYAVKMNQLETVKILLDFNITGTKASVATWSDNAGNTPLHFACQTKNYAMICLLLTNPGSTLFILNHKGKTALDELLKHGNNLAIKDESGKNMLEHFINLELVSNIKINSRVMRKITAFCKVQDQQKPTAEKKSQSRKKRKFDHCYDDEQNESGASTLSDILVSENSSPRATPHLFVAASSSTSTTPPITTTFTSTTPASSTSSSSTATQIHMAMDVKDIEELPAFSYFGFNNF